MEAMMAKRWIAVSAGIVLFAAIYFYINRSSHNTLHSTYDEENDEECDFVIVGAGTGGLALAARLTEVNDWNVCVLERGPKEGYMSGWNTDSFKWTSPHDPVWLTQPTLRTMETVKGRPKNVKRDGRMIYIPRWRGRGGTSRVYGAIVRRASPAVLDLWPKGWKHDDLLPYYKKSEDHYCYYDSEDSTDTTPEDCEYWHGKGGPMQVNPLMKEVFSEFPKAIKTICEDRTMPWRGYAGDYNGPLDARKSCSSFQQFKDRTNKWYNPTKEARKNRAAKTARGSSYTGYYKHNKPPTVIFGAIVTKILFEDRRAVGVLYLDGTTGRTLELRARKEVIVSGGAFDTPHLLQISGVGPRELLRNIHVEVVGENQHVGENLWDHLSVPYVLKLAQAADHLPATVNIDGTEYNNTGELFKINGPFSWILHSRSNVTEREPRDMSDVQLYVMGNSSLFDETADLCTTSKEDSDVGDISLQGTIRIIDQWPEYRGSIRAKTSNIFDKPVLDYGWDYKLDNKTSAAFKNVAKVIRDQIRLLREIFFGIDVPESLKTLVLDEVEPGRDRTTDEELNKWIRHMVVSALHPACSCKMPDCADEFLRVRNVSNLRICDTSAFATQIDGNPVATIFAMSEKLAEMLKDEYLDNIHLAFRQDFAMCVEEGMTKIKFKLAEENIMSHTKCEDVQISHQWIDTGKDTSTILATCTLRLCRSSSSPQAIADIVALDVLEAIGIEAGGVEGYPRFDRPEAMFPYNKYQPDGSRVKPFVFVVWRQLFPNIFPAKLWEKVGRWKGDPIPGSLNSLKLNCQPRVYMKLHNYNATTLELTYIEEESSFPAVNYTATKKVHTHAKHSSAFYRTASMLAKPNIDWYRDLADFLLEDVFASSGRSYARQFPPLASRSGWWYETSYGLLIYQFMEYAGPGEKIAGFDLYNTVIESGDDWKFTSQVVPNKLRENHNKDILNVIFTNMLSSGSRYRHYKHDWMQMIENVAATIGVPLYVIAATKHNEYWKPNIGMWTYLNCTVNQFKTINRQESLYVGDSDSDKMFADNINIAFKTPEDYFN